MGAIAVETRLAIESFPQTPRIQIPVRPCYLRPVKSYFPTLLTKQLKLFATLIRKVFLS